MSNQTQAKTDVALSLHSDEGVVILVDESVKKIPTNIELSIKSSGVAFMRFSLENDVNYEIWLPKDYVTEIVRHKRVAIGCVNPNPNNEGDIIIGYDIDAQSLSLI
ncbi:hypothetical protein AB6D11_00055 [Vibrio splendidus]